MANIMFYIGVDLGQKQDYTAIAVVERGDRKKLLVRHVERVPLGTSYPKVVDLVGAITQHEDLVGQCCLAVDATGVGTPVVDTVPRRSPRSPGAPLPSTAP